VEFCYLIITERQVETKRSLIPNGFLNKFYERIIDYQWPERVMLDLLISNDKTIAYATYKV